MDSLLVSLLLGLGTAAVLLLIAGLVKPKKSAKLPLPPGPKALPLLGNLKDMPTPGSPQWEHWAKHRDLYGKHCMTTRTRKQHQADFAL